MPAGDYDHHHAKARVELLANDPWCAHCGNPAEIADHQPPLALHDHVRGSGCCVLVPSCRPCSLRQAGQVSKAVVAARQQVLVEPEPEPIAPDDDCWRVPWLADLVDVPPDGIWPRWLTAPHPDAVGSYGIELELMARCELRWWQRLAMRMILQHDSSGQLLFDSVLLSTRRQVGKTVAIRELAWWRVQSAVHFADQQHVLHTARTLKPARDAIAPVLLELVGSTPTSRAAGIWRISMFDGSTWTALAQKSAYGETASLALIDEAWDVKVASIDEGIEPTTAARESGQLVLVSTAHRRCTSLMPSRRAEALGLLRQPEQGTLIIEWSAPRDADIGDPAVWRMAAPYWRGDADVRKLRKIYERAVQGIGADAAEPDPIEAWRAQWLNIWPLRAITSRQGGDGFVTLEQWHRLQVPPERRLYSDAVIALEDHGGLGVGAVRVSVDDPRYVVEAFTFDSRPEAFDWLSERMAGVSLVLAGVTLAQDPTLRSIALAIEKVGTIETTRALPLLRSMITSGRVWHLESAQLDAQIADLRVREQAGGLAVASRERSDLIRCMAWGIQWLNDSAGVVPGVH